MKRISLIIILALTAHVRLFAIDSLKVQQTVNTKISLFPLSNLRITGGQFKHIMDLDHDYLLTLEPDKLLSWFRREAGLTPKATPYPGWESETAVNRSPLSGHIMGFYLSSMAMMYASTGDEKIIDRLKYTLAGLQECQQANQNGYLLPTINGKHIFEDVAAGNFKTSNPFITSTSSDMDYNYWEPVYVLNKIMLGLNRVYLDCHLPLAKAILVSTAHWFGTGIIDKLSHEQLQQLLFCEHGSINESFVNVYQLTGNKKYLQWAQRLNDEKMLLPASKGDDILNGWHANTQIPKFTGFENIYNYTGDKSLSNAARFFWSAVVNNRSWVIGGNSTAEHFFPKSDFDKRITEPGGPESCNSVNMMRLTEALYQDYAEPEKLDYYERVLYNHILANYNPENGMCVYYTSMRPGHYKVYSSLYDSFWCCTGTGFEAPAKFAQMTYAHDTEHLYINLFMPATLNWAEKGLQVVQTTRFPDQDDSKITMHLKSPTSMSIRIRRPQWLTNASSGILVNGKKQNIKVVNGYAEINRLWSDGDEIDLDLKGKLQIETLSDSNKYIAFLYGPIVLAAKVADHGLKKDDFTQVQTGFAVQTIPLNEAPSFTGGVNQLKKTIKRVKGSKLEYALTAEDGKSVDLVPFNQIAFSRYAVYFRHADSKGFYDNEIANDKRIATEKQELDQATVDRIIIGDHQSEQQHQFQGVFSNSGGAADNGWRDANHGGYFMYNLKLAGNKPYRIYMVFSGNDEGARIFDLLVDGRLLKTLDHSHKVASANGGLYPVVIDVPEVLTKDKDNITIKLQAHRNNTAGGIFDLRLLY